MIMLSEIKEATSYIQKQLPEDWSPEIGIVLGTGLGGLVNEVDVLKEISYEAIPHFPVSTVEFHSGKLILGTIAKKKVVVMQGRFHYYEGYGFEQIVFPVRVMKFLGISDLFISNAAGGINPKLNRGDLMMITDHINHFPGNPLIGVNEEELGPRFPDMSQVYNKDYQELARSISNDHDIELKEGVYLGLPGPMLETPAEYKYLGVIGADAVGMSTVPEVIAGTHMGLNIFACSIITDICYGEIKPVDIKEIIETAMSAEPDLTKLVKNLIDRL